MMRAAPLLLLLAALPAAAQQQRLLERADSLLLAGKYSEARAALADWQRANPANASVQPAQRARALYLNARLTTDAAKALETYLTIALSYPTAREAPEALLRIGQTLMADGDAPRARRYLAQLVNDYPNAGNKAQGALWLARAQLAAGDPTAACASATNALKTAGPSAEIATLLHAEEKTACAALTRPRTAGPQDQSERDSAARNASGPPPAGRPLPERGSAPSRDVRGARFALQTAALRDTNNAAALAAALRRKGFDGRVAWVEGSGLARVRVGRFTTREAAVSELKRLQHAGISAIIVDDVARERR